MFEKIFPGVVDNNYSGNRIALYFFYLVTVITIGRSCIHIFAADGGAQSIATIPLDSFTAAGAEAVIYIFGLWGIAQIMMGLMYLLVALRYQSLIPLMYLFVFFEWSSRLIYSFLNSIETTGTAPAAIGQLLLIVLVPIMLVFSLRETKQQGPV